MESVFRTWKTSREQYLNYFETYTLEQLNKTPKGFSNNLIWNIGHVIVAQQALVYKGCNLEGNVSRELFDRYKPGTKPTGNTTAEEVTELKELLISLVEKTESDYAKGTFVEFNERMTGTGFYLITIKDAFQFNNYHEAIHLGLMMNIKKFI